MRSTQPMLLVLVIHLAHVVEVLSGLTGTVVAPVGNYLFSQDGCPVSDGVCPSPNITYLLYTRSTQNNPHELDPFYPDTMKYAKFVEGAPLKVIIHGYTGNKDYSPNMELRPAYFQHGEYNIITIDWGKLAKEPCYWEAAHNVESVSTCAAEFMDLLYQMRPDLSIENTHMLGFSLGAHTVGLMASKLKTGKVARVTGMDPALPLFDKWTNSATSLINKYVGHFVDIIHTNAGHKGKNAVGGTLDIYVNNGAAQPGCNCNSSCDHVRAVEYYAESINSKVGFWAFPCWSWSFYNNGFCKVTSPDELIQVGEWVNVSNYGVYTALTHDKKPYLMEPNLYIEDSNMTDKVDVSCSWL